MKTSFTVSARDLSRLIRIVSNADPNWKIQDWILDVIGVPPESDVDWNSLSKDELVSGFSDEGFVLCCRENLNKMVTPDAENEEVAMSIIASWIESSEQADRPLRR
jgi:hypothetical protein